MGQATATRPTAGKTVTLPISDLIRDPLLRSRVGPLDGDHVAGMAESVTAGHPPPPPTVFKIAGRGHFLVAGWCTVAGYELAGATEVPAVVIKGSWVEAVEHVVRQNREYDQAGKKRTRADMRHAAMMLITARPECSDRDIAKKVGISPTTVGSARKRLAEARLEVSNLDTSEGDDQDHETEDPIHFRLGQDGKWYPLPLPGRSRDSSRKEHLEDLQPSWESFGGQILPLLKNGIPLPRVLASNQVNLKQISWFTGQLLDYFNEPKFSRPAGRMLTVEEMAEEFEALYAKVFHMLYAGGKKAEELAEAMEVLRDPRFPTAALP